MSFERPITVKDIVLGIEQKEYFLPSIQRELVWSTDKIERLYDSLMQDYPIGSFLFWEVKAENTKDYQFYDFVRDYHEKTSKHNPKASIPKNGRIIAVLDGQQRLTSLFLGLKGSYAYKSRYRRITDPDAYPKRKLYLNLLSPCNREESDMKYDFRFLTKDEASVMTQDYHWFEVGDILSFTEEAQINDYLIKQKLMASKDEEKNLFANRTLFKLFKVINDSEIINFYLEKQNSLDKVLNIFIRINSGGEILSYSDLLLSVATAQWKKRDAREEIYDFLDELNDIGDGFKFDKDLILKTCLMLNESDIEYKADNFKRDKMLSIETKWGKIKESLFYAVTLASNFGYTTERLTSSNALIPIAYYLYKKKSPKSFVSNPQRDIKRDRMDIQEWLILSLLKRAFGGKPDNVLLPIRKAILQNSSKFPLKKIIELFRGKSKSIIFNKDDIDALFDYRYGQSYTFSALALIYPTLDFKNIFHIDHIFPKNLMNKSYLKKKRLNNEQIEFYLDNFNYLANLQLIEGPENQSKSDMEFDKWLKKQYPIKRDRENYKKKNFIPDVDLSFNNFEEFINKRTRLLKAEYNKILTRYS